MGATHGDLLCHLQEAPGRGAGRGATQVSLREEAHSGESEGGGHQALLPGTSWTQSKISRLFLLSLPLGYFPLKSYYLSALLIKINLADCGSLERKIYKRGLASAPAPELPPRLPVSTGNGKIEVTGSLSQPVSDQAFQGQNTRWALPQVLSQLGLQHRGHEKSGGHSF